MKILVAGTLRTLLTAAFVAGLWTASVGAATFDNMVAFDGVYIPALALTTAARQDATVAVRARNAMQELKTRWPALRAGLLQDLQGVPAESARKTLDKVALHISTAEMAVAGGNFKGAHEALEAVRIELMNARNAHGMDYFVDRLTAYHEPMEILALAALDLKPHELTPAKRTELETAYAEARAIWRGIEKNPPDPKVYALTPARSEQLSKALADETEALSRLSDALRGTDNAAVLKAAAALKPAFARVFTAFGQG
jgi:hypothetical protein